ncbi:hypothetical protein RN001_008299 [Aquatica leii]|uniref:MICOS complex subunit n=1 Tax=Aquatica leii TaxID=1421715 RepID=A0AAN7SP71_9COLE|nr:hypothetical protein RN001_008299 [Aquatica leii]
MLSGRLGRYALVFSGVCVTDATAAEETCVCKPSELPIYTKDPNALKQTEVCLPAEAGPIETSVGSVRRTVVKMTDDFNRVSYEAQDSFEKALKGAGGFIEYLQKKENVTPKYGAIAIGGFTGFIFSLRGRPIQRKLSKKVIYTSIGALAMAALCYPKEATKYSNIARGYATIAMNFIYGVEKDDPSLQLPTLPTFPNSINDVWDKIKKFSSTVTDQTPPPQVKRKDIDTVQIITDAHDLATSKSCHCPIGSCMGSHEETVSPPPPPVECVNPE